MKLTGCWPLALPHAAAPDVGPGGGAHTRVTRLSCASAAAMDNYHVLELIGEGSFGKVYKVRANAPRPCCARAPHRNTLRRHSTSGGLASAHHAGGSARPALSKNALAD